MAFGMFLLLYVSFPIQHWCNKTHVRTHPEWLQVLRIASVG